MPTSRNISHYDNKPIHFYVNGILNIYRWPLMLLITECFKQEKFSLSEISEITGIDLSTISRKLFIRNGKEVYADSTHP